MDWCPGDMILNALRTCGENKNKLIMTNYLHRQNRFGRSDGGLMATYLALPPRRCR